MKTWPIIGNLKKYNPYDTDAQVLGRALSALVPNLARGVYGEVGVLTDADIRTYTKTIPNLSQTDDVNKLVLAMTIDTLAGGYKRQLATQAAAWRDVSSFTGVYKELKSKADSIKKELGVLDEFEEGVDSDFEYTPSESAWYRPITFWLFGFGWGSEEWRPPEDNEEIGNF